MFAPLWYAKKRHEMVEDQLVRRGIADARVLAAMDRIPREIFLPPDLRREAYRDRAVAIECGQTISQPYIVALMTEALELAGHEKVLEVGTGSGYQTAVLSQLAGEVVSIERHPELAKSAAERLQHLSIGNVQFRVGDGTLGCPADAPFDRIIVTAAAGVVPPALLEQMVEGGLLVIPVGDDQSQSLQVVHKLAGHTQVRRLTGCRFVPLVGFCAPDSPSRWSDASGPESASG
ncbi:MAG TPA: protein-L-isoaspartate(D-aspartate) O-methyltransferase [Pirellulales bacterium]|jgi:protein-L-isoaspartate(D-aspartate) O-methyltransferase|nr:protein-L-isoaspartate(D-aspartate) O-methyltransferase [Pirellulales bacterium]